MFLSNTFVLNYCQPPFISFSNSACDAKSFYAEMGKLQVVAFLPIMPLFRFDSEGAIEDGFSVRAVKAAVEWAVGKGVEVSKYVNSQKNLKSDFRDFFVKVSKVFFWKAYLFFFCYIKKVQTFF